MSIQNVSPGQKLNKSEHLIHGWLIRFYFSHLKMKHNHEFFYRQLKFKSLQN